MKKILMLFLLVIFLASCDIYIDEQPRRRDDHNRFVGHYRIEEYSDTYEVIAEYSIEIRSSLAYRDRIYIRNFYDSGLEVYAEVNDDRIMIPFQVVNGYEIRGRGYRYGSELELFYDVTDLESHRLVTDYCDAVAWRR